MLLSYLKLQLRILHRRIRAFGLPVWAGYLLAIGLFGGISWQIGKPNMPFYAVYLYILIPLQWAGRLSAPARNDFLQNTFSKTDYRRVRWAENTLISLPFGLFLAYRGAWLPCLLLCLSSSLFAFLRVRLGGTRAIPTPFYHRPFEFLVGFRQTYPFLLLAYALAGVSAWVGNESIGVFAVAMLFLVCAFYHVAPEDAYFVWVYSQTPRAFLWRKYQTALLYASMLALPAEIVLLVRFPAGWSMLLLVHLAGFLYILFLLLLKYSTFPDEMNLPQSLLMVVCFLFPPLLVVLLPYLYQKSCKNIRPYLHDNPPKPR